MGLLEHSNRGFEAAGQIVKKRPSALPKWLGWAGLVVALELVFARAFWEQSGAVLIYAFFWLRMILTSLILIRRAGDGGPASTLPRD
jgi:hypothetical protein